MFIVLQHARTNSVAARSAMPLLGIKRVLEVVERTPSGSHITGTVRLSRK
jgi:hypothetical protein